MNLGKRLTLMIAGLVFAALGVLSLTVMIAEKSDTKEMIVAQLTQQREAALEGFSTYLSTIENDLSLWANLSLTQEALQDFSRAWQSAGAFATRDLQRLYISENPHPTGQKDKLLSADDGSAYSYTHAKYHPEFTTLKDLRGYYDVFLLDVEGNLVYSVYKELDFATNFANGFYANSGLGEAFRAARDGAPGEVAFTDFAPYDPSNNAPASFIARQVLDAEGRFLGVIAFQMPVDRLSALVGDLGGGFNAMVIGADGLLRTDDARFGDGAILVQKISGATVDAALAGDISTATVSRDGVAYFQSGAPLEFKGTTWAFISEIKEGLAFAPIAEMRNRLMLIALVCLCVSVVVSFLLARSIARPVVSLTGALGKLAEADLQVTIAHTERADEMGMIARSIDVLRERLIEAESQREENKAAEAREVAARVSQQRIESENLAREKEEEAQHRLAAEATRKAELAIAAEIARVVEACSNGMFGERLEVEDKEGVFRDLCEGINLIGERTERALGDISQAVAALERGDLTHRMTDQGRGIFGEISDAMNATLSKLSSVVNSIRNSTGVVNNFAGELADSAESLSKRTENNAAALEETSAALIELEAAVKSAAEHANGAQANATDVVKEVGNGIKVVSDAVTAMEEIRKSTEEITKFIDLINDISFQTNLLALNAGVEAARAGETGRGFAVVAAEVRVLAARSSQAAQDIAELISDSNTKVDDGVRLVNQSGEGLHLISQAINEVAEKIVSVASSTGEQVLGLQEITVATNDLDRTTQQNAAMFEETTAAIKVMKNEAVVLMEAVKAFSVTEENTAAVRPTMLQPSQARDTDPGSLNQTPPPKPMQNANALVHGNLALARAEDPQADGWAEF